MWFWPSERMAGGYYPFYFVPFSEDSHKCVNKCEKEIKGTARLPITLPLGHVAITELGQMPRALNSKGGYLKWVIYWGDIRRTAGQILLGDEVTPWASGSHFGNYINLQQPEYGVAKCHQRLRPIDFYSEQKGWLVMYLFPSAIRL